MTPTNPIKPTHKAIKAYYEALAAYARQDVSHEMAVRSAFQNLLDEIGRRFGWTLIPELPEAGPTKDIRPDGTFRDDYYITRGYWEAKDTRDHLETEIKRKIAKGYPLSNMIFEDTRQAYLYQQGQVALKADLQKPQQLADLLHAFFSYTEPAHEDFEKAVDEFKERVPDLARGLVDKIRDAHRNNPRFIEAFNRFYELCRSSLNPNLSEAAVDEMLVQHLLTERLIRTIFDNQDFTRRNVIAAEVETVIDALVSKSFNRHQFLKSLDRFYLAIESAAATIESFAEKQHFLNTVYERFFQGYSIKVADTHGIVYTPQEIVDFMCSSVVEVLEKEFGKALGDEGVNILDPCTGTGNFIVNLIRRIPKKDLPRMYRRQLFANEVMLLPYYIAALNIEHAYYERTGAYEPFDGLCFVDTLDLVDKKQSTFSFMTEENAARVERQRSAPITVIIGNPPYNQSQQDENDNNKNRTYDAIERQIKATYVRDCSSTLRMQAYDPYIKFFRWATNRLQGRNGIVCMVTNNGFVQAASLSGFRLHLARDFAKIYHFDFKGNARTTGERRRREGGNVFEDKIRAGVGVTLLIRRNARSKTRILYHAVGDYWKAVAKSRYIASNASLSHIRWSKLTPDSNGDWLIPEHAEEFRRLLPLGSKTAKRRALSDSGVVFQLYSSGVKTNSDPYVYDFQELALVDRAQAMVEAFNTALDRWKRKEKPRDLRDVLMVDPAVLKWIRNTKRTLLRGNYLHFARDYIRTGLYRPFAKRFYYFERAFNEDTYRFPHILPSNAVESENRIICCTIEPQIPFSALVANTIPCLHVGGRQGQCFPFYLYNEDGTNRRDNVTDWAVEYFRKHYADKRITKWDIFHYVFGILNHPGYGARYAENLKRKLPRITLAPDFRAFSKAGYKLARLHLDYEKLDPWPLEWVESPGLPLSYQVEKMRLAKDKTSLAVNDSLTLGGIPPDVFRYRLGNRSALEWVIDQYQVSQDKRSGIRSDPNRPDDPEYIVRLVGQVVRVSIETMKLVDALPPHFGVPG